MKIPMWSCVLSVAFVLGCGGGQSAEPDSTPAAGGSTAAQSEGGGSAAGASGEWIEACDTLDEVEVAETFGAAEVIEAPGYNSERQRANTTDCGWTFQFEGRPAEVSVYIRRASEQAPPDAMANVMETTVRDGENIGGDVLATTEIELPGAARAAMTEEHEARYSRTRGLVLLDDAQRLWKVSLTVSADDEGTVGGPIDEQRLRDVWLRIASR